LNSNGAVKMSDFGISSFLENPNSKRYTFTGTPYWMAPEVIDSNKNGYGSKADIWSFGITMLELAKGMAPYQKFSPMKAILLTLKEDPPNLDTYETNNIDTSMVNLVQPSTKPLKKKPLSYFFSKFLHKSDYSVAFQDVIEACLQKDPAKRPTATKLREYKFFRKTLSYNKLIKKKNIGNLFDKVPTIKTTI
jgi:serine/threonine-protein kinase OSR1/STK39